MIPITQVRLSFEKTAFNKKDAARKAAEYIGRGLIGVSKFVYKHPFATIGTAGAAIAAGALTSKILPAYTIMNEERKRRIMLHEKDFLKQIAEQTGRIPEKKEYTQPFAVEPLA